MKLYVVGMYVLVFVLTVIWQAPVMAQTAAAADPAPSAPAATNPTPVDPAKRLDELVAVMRAAAQGFGKSAEEQDKLEEDLRKTAEFCAKHRFPMPVGIDIGFNLDAGFVVGGVSGVDLVFMFQNDGTLGVGLFPSVDAQIGLGAAAGGSFAASLVFNMNSVNDYVGSSMGISGGITIGAGAGLNLNLGITIHDFAGLVKTFKDQYHKDGSQDVREDLGEWLKTLVAPGRSFTAGLGVGFGLGTPINTQKGYTFKSYEKSIPSNLDAVQQEAADVREKLHQDKEHLEHFLIPDDVRSDFEKAKSGFEEEHRLRENLKQDIEDRAHDRDQDPDQP
jgi:hypothetical protein